jgi:pimeloyl-ACP methyl ester carboxylesterase
MYPSSMLRKQIVNQSSIKPTVRAYIEDACAKVVSGQDFITIWAEVTDCIHEEPGYHIPCSLLLMRGEQDKLGNFKSAMPKWAKRDQAQYEIIPDAGHTANQDNPKQVNHLLQEFLRQHVTV